MKFKGYTEYEPTKTTPPTKKLAKSLVCQSEACERSEHTVSTNTNTMYLVTVRKSQVKDHVTDTDIDAILCMLDDSIPHFKVHCEGREIGPVYNQYHAHLRVSVPRGFQYKEYTQFSGFHIDWKVITDGKEDNYKLVDKYITKNADEIHDVINEYQEYAF